MIQWYPGHMAKAIREMGENVKLVDLVVILVDGRAPSSSINPKLEELFQNKKCIYVLTKKDKSDTKKVNEWIKHFTALGNYAISLNLKENSSLKPFFNVLNSAMEEKRQKDLKKGLKIRPAKLMMVGIPNVGKSTFINRLVGKKVVAVGDKPGVTKLQQWIRVNENRKDPKEKCELLDTPGVLWPKFDDQIVGYNLALIGSISDNVVSLEKLALYLIEYLQKNYPGVLFKRYELDEAIEANFYLNKLSKIKHLTELEMAKVLINDFRNGYLGCVTLDEVSE